MNDSTLYIVATPIGNLEDITLRALRILKEVDFIILEEFKEGTTLLKQYHLREKELVQLNEHNEKDIAGQIVSRMKENGESAALISDCGTPIFADPGHFLIKLCITTEINVVPIPGPSSLMAALSVLPFSPDQFVFGGFLPRKQEQRILFLQRLKKNRKPLVIMDTPYRLTALLTDVAEVFGGDHEITLATSITLPEEKIYRGMVKKVLSQVRDQKLEFILIIH
ncbi:MAG: 16S rRNA (cytidine(1402)-2'-O)-methyltransferase [Anaerolineales bacterium]|nr:16S rRNA (cytidine(1402)-2'-O)-methyltransferase [Anaerolineales bacterium]